MYAPTYPASSSSPYTSPTAAPIDPYRPSPISVVPKQPYNSAFSPPQQPNGIGNGFAAMPSGHSQRYQQQQYSPQQYARAGPGPGPGGGSSRYTSPVPPYPNGSFAAQQPLPPPPLPPQRHKGTLAPGQLVRVGDQTVRIERYLSEGGYAHVYLTTSEKPIYPPVKGEKKGRWGEKGYTQHCLKRIAFEDDAVWIDVKKEIEVMKSLPPNPHLTQYLGSAHSRTPTGGHEVFILMEFCSGGGIIDLLNKRLRDRLKEIEILNIFTDVCEAVAAMHALSQPLLHRDLKIENVLSEPIQAPPTPQRPTPLVFKLCDFGSTTYPADKPPSTKVEADALAMDLNRQTTLQYRSPEMVEPMLGLPVGLPSDVWALGCLLYKLCYYTTPFEEHGPLAIVNAKYSFPPVPAYSPRLQHLIASMLVEQPVRRPTVFEILKISHEMSGTNPEVDYPTPSRSVPRPSQQKEHSKPSQSTNLLDFTSSSSPIDNTPALQPTLASTVQPQRRGRPTREPSQKQISPAVSSHSTPVPTNQIQTNARPTASRLQVTGEKFSPRVDAAPTATLDAFGMPTMSSSTSSTERGFSDSFAAPGPKANYPAGPSKFGSNLPRPPSGFGDSFGGARSPAASSTSPKKSPMNTTFNRVPSSSGASMGKSPTSSTSTRKPADPSSSIPAGEVSFETRFPSIETLSADDGIPVREDNKPETLISPINMPPAERPPFHAKVSMMGNMTGGDLNSPTQLTNRVPGGAPQPRSTQVTGTAFKGIQGGVRSPSPVQTRTDYFDNLKPDERPAASPSISSVSTAKSLVPQDLMSGDEQSGLQLPSIQPGRSVSPAVSAVSSSSTSRPLPSPSLAGVPPVQATGHSRPLLPHIESAKPSSNIMSDQWSPLESLRRTNSSKKFEEDSSDDEAGPENASGRGVRPGSSTTATKPEQRNNSQSWRQTTIERTSSLARGTSPTKSTTMNIPTQSGRTTTSRPQSMYAMPPSNSLKSISSLSPKVTEEPSTLPSPSGRPSHGRKGSITDIVSRYESLKSPSQAQIATATSDQRGSSTTTTGIDGPGLTRSASTVTANNGLGRKPSVASKPQALRKPTLDQNPSKQVSPTIALSPNTSASTGISTTVSRSPGSSPIEPTKPRISTSKPIIVAPKPVRHAEAPRPAGFSRSSSGRAFPITKPASNTVITTGNRTGNGNEGIEKKQAGDGSAPSSPEKQQSVNSLIARWNQGQTANANANTSAAKPKRGGGFI